MKEMEMRERGVYMPSSALLGTPSSVPTFPPTFPSPNQVRPNPTKQSDGNIENVHVIMSHISCYPGLCYKPRTSSPTFSTKLSKTWLLRWYRGVLEACGGEVQGGHRNPSADMLGTHGRSLTQRHFSAEALRRGSTEPNFTRIHGGKSATSLCFSWAEFHLRGA